jgi:hypothetical protein
MGYLWLPLEKAHLPVYQVCLANNKHFLYISNALEPNEFKGAGTVFYFGHQAFGPFFTNDTEAGDHSFDLNEVRLRHNVAHLVHFGFIDVAIGYQFEQVFKSEYVQLFFEHVGPLRPYTFQVLDGIG